METAKGKAPRESSFLRRETYIRNAGALLILSPFGNFLWAAACTGTHGWYRPRLLHYFIAHVPAPLWILWTLTLIAGAQMLKGKRSSWNFTLFVLGVNIIFGITTFKRDLNGGWFQPTLSLLMNFGLFALIYVQEFHQRLERRFLAAREAAHATAQALQNRPLALTLGFDLPVFFEDGAQGSPGAGSAGVSAVPSGAASAPTPWAMITEVTHTGVRLRSVSGEGPRQIEFRTVELFLEPGVSLRARFSAKAGPDFFFRFIEMDAAKLQQLHRWARNLGARGPVVFGGAGAEGSARAPGASAEPVRAQSVHRAAGISGSAAEVSGPPKSNRAA